MGVASNQRIKVVSLDLEYVWQGECECLVFVVSLKLSEVLFTSNEISFFLPSLT